MFEENPYKTDIIKSVNEPITVCPSDIVGDISCDRFTNAVILSISAEDPISTPPPVFLF